MLLTGDILPAKKYVRIISTVPSLTELLYDLGLEEEVIGITKFCIYPEKWFREKTRIGGTKDLNIEKIISLNPDLIIANKEENTESQIKLLAENVDVLLTEIDDLEEALQAIKIIGAFVNRHEEAQTLAEKIDSSFKNLDANLSIKNKKVAYFIWQNPFMVAGGNTFITDMLKRSGLENVFQDLPRYPQISEKQIRESGAEILFLSSEPYPFKEKHAKEFKKLFPEMKIILVDGEMYSWYGSRLLQSPDYFHQVNRRLGNFN